MKFFKMLEIVSVKNQGDLELIKDGLEDRLMTVEMQEPMSDGVTYEKWEEKYDGINDLVDLANELYDEEDVEKKQLLLEQLKNDAFDYQCNYGGLKMLEI